MNKQPLLKHFENETQIMLNRNREHTLTAITANKLCAEAHVLLHHLRRLSSQGEVPEEESSLRDVDAGGARVLPTPLHQKF